MENVFLQKSKMRIKENIWTFANFVTLARVTFCIIIFYLAFTNLKITWAYIGLLIHWVLDALDGYFARLLNQETLFGAQIDILADRLLIVFFYINYSLLNQFLIMPVMLFMFEFVFLDAYLSIQFLNWDIISPNYFYMVDKFIWKLNWSPPAKVVNSGLITILLITIDAPQLVSLIVLFLISIKIFSFIRLQRMTNDYYFEENNV